MVQLSIVIFFGLFAVVEIYQSVKNVQLPLPVYLALGIALAVVSNLSALNPPTSASLPLLPVNLMPPEQAAVIPRIE
jgi:hypothetical protein